MSTYSRTILFVLNSLPSRSIDARISPSQRTGRPRGLCAQLVQCAGSANPAAGEQNQPITNPLCIDQLMNGENECSAASSMVAEHADDLARLPQIEAVEWLIHQQHRMRRQQSQRQQQSTVVSFRQRMHALVENGR